MNNDFNMCPMCGSKKIINHGNRKWVCQDCGFDLYCNVAAAVGVVVYDKNNNVLFEVRAKEPRKGYLCLPGGFVDFDESAEEAIERECREELGLEIKDIEFLCTYPNTYVYKNIEYKTCDMFFAVKLPSKYKDIDELISTLNADKREVQDVLSAKVESLDDVEKLQLAFGSAVSTLKKFVNRSSNDK